MKVELKASLPTAHVILALKKLLEQDSHAMEKEARSAVSSGVYSIDETVQIKGSLKVGEPSERTPTARIGQLRLLGALYSTLIDPSQGFSRDQACAFIEMVVERAMLTNPETFEEGEIKEEVESAITRVQGRIKEVGEKIKVAARVSFVGILTTPRPSLRPPSVPRPRG